MDLKRKIRKGVFVLIFILICGCNKQPEHKFFYLVHIATGERIVVGNDIHTLKDKHGNLWKVWHDELGQLHKIDDADMWTLYIVRN